MSFCVWLAEGAMSILFIYHFLRGVWRWTETQRGPRGLWVLALQSVLALNVLEAGRLAEEPVAAIVGAVWAGWTTWLLARRTSNE